MWREKRYQVGDDIATHWYTYFLLFERLKIIKIFYSGLVYVFLFLFWLNHGKLKFNILLLFNFLVKMKNYKIIYLFIYFYNY